MWNIVPGAKNQAFLQQTCVFNGGDEMSSRDLDGLLLSHVVWNSTGKLLAAAVDNLINIWQLTGTTSTVAHVVSQSLLAESQLSSSCFSSFSSWHLQGPHTSCKVLESHGIFLLKFPLSGKSWKMNGPGKSWKLKLKVLESPEIYLLFKLTTTVLSSEFGLLLAEIK